MGNKMSYFDIPHVPMRHSRPFDLLFTSFLRRTRSYKSRVKRLPHKYKYAANCTGSKLSQCSAIIFLMKMSLRIRQYQLKKSL